MNVLQELLFPFEELIDFSPYEGLEKLLQEINYSPLKKLENWKRGRKGHNKAAMLKAFVAKDVLQINTTTELYKTLRWDIVLRLLCGFSLGERLPSLSTFSRFYATLDKRLVNKFRCPKAVGKDVTCNRECNCNSSYGKVTNVSIRNNPRLFSSPHRGSKQWKKLYSLRWHVERLFNVLKNKLNLGQIRVRGLSKVTLHVNICNLAYMAGTIAMLKQKSLGKTA